MGLAKLFCKSDIRINYMHVVLRMDVVLEDLLKIWETDY
jgi:hypothetical protein